MAILELINLRKARKAIGYLLCIVVALWLQTMVLSRLTLLGVKAFFLPAFIVAIGMWEGGAWGGALGLAAGVGCTLSMAGSPVLFVVLLPAFGFLSGLLADFIINRRFVSYMLLAVLALLLTAFLQALPLWLFHGAQPRGLFTVAALQAAWSVPFAVPTYFIAKRLAGHERSRP
ncbi:MAG: hypothetical protein E7427_06950 [Ruminococcaceae bacterium]|nr:hypothetical protein [Oscillospiraceae bacterium]